MSLLFSVPIDLILFKLADKKEMHNILDEFQFWPAFDHPKKWGKWCLGFFMVVLLT